MSSRRGPPKRVLVVDDHREVAELLRILLAERGHEASVVGLGDRAVEEVRRFRPDLVLLDLSLPDVGGEEVARRVRAGGGPQPRLVALTGHRVEDVRQRCLDAGFDGVGTKPDRLEELEAFLEAQLVP